MSVQRTLWLSCAIGLSGSATAQEGPLRNGDFEWPVNCVWVGESDFTSDPPFIHVDTNDARCSWLRLKSNDPSATYQEASQTFDIDATDDDWVVIEFDANVSANDRAFIELKVGSASDFRLLDAGGWTTLSHCVKSPVDDPEVTVKFGICSINAIQLDVDNVVVSVTSSDPGCTDFNDVCSNSGDPSSLDREPDDEFCCPEDCEYPPDGFVDFDDILAVLDEWGSFCSRADVNADGTVDSDDLDAVILVYGVTCGGTADPDDLVDDLDCMDIDEDCWDDMLDTLTNGTAGEQADVICWIVHYESCHCPDVCVGGPTNCGSDPCGNH